MTKFDQIEDLLLQLIEGSVHVLSESEISEIRRFIDVGEYGLALETAIDIHVEEKKKPSDNVVDLMERLATLMSMDTEKLLMHVRLLKSGKME